MKVRIQRIECCQQCPFCWAGVECVEKNKYFNDGELKISRSDVQSWCPLPDESEEKK